MLLYEIGHEMNWIRRRSELGAANFSTEASFPHIVLCVWKLRKGRERRQTEKDGYHGEREI